MGLLDGFISILFVICVALIAFMVLLIVFVIATFLFAAITQTLFPVEYILVKGES